MFEKLLIRLVLMAFLFTSVGPLPDASAQSLIGLPAPGTMVDFSPKFNQAGLKGIIFHPENPFKFDFILDEGDVHLNQQESKAQIQKMAAYFLASLTTPEKEIWVNLSPYEKSRIVPPFFGKTLMGQNLLAQDYMLKQIMATALYPERQLGHEFWQKVYQQALIRFGTTNIPINTFNKVWIVPDKAVVYENAKMNAVFVAESSLKVMLEKDYLAEQKHSGISDAPRGNNVLDSVADTMSSAVIKELVIPALEKEVNTGKNFAPLRQVYNALILAKWYKDNLKNNVIAKGYVDRNKIAGVESHDKQRVSEIYRQYLKAYKKGVFNFIKEDFDKASQSNVPRKYFSGGFMGFVDETVDNSPAEGAIVAAGFTGSRNLIARISLTATAAASAFLRKFISPGALTTNLFASSQGGLPYAPHQNSAMISEKSEEQAFSINGIPVSIPREKQRQGYDLNFELKILDETLSKVVNGEWMLSDEDVWASVVNSILTLHHMGEGAIIRDRILAYQKLLEPSGRINMGLAFQQATRTETDLDQERTRLGWNDLTLRGFFVADPEKGIANFTKFLNAGVFLQDDRGYVRLNRLIRRPREMMADEYNEIWNSLVQQQMVAKLLDIMQMVYQDLEPLKANEELGTSHFNIEAPQRLSDEAAYIARNIAAFQKEFDSSLEPFAWDGGDIIFDSREPVGIQVVDEVEKDPNIPLMFDAAEDKILIGSKAKWLEPIELISLLQQARREARLYRMKQNLAKVLSLSIAQEDTVQSKMSLIVDGGGSLSQFIMFCNMSGQLSFESVDSFLDSLLEGKVWSDEELIDLISPQKPPKEEVALSDYRIVRFIKSIFGFIKEHPKTVIVPMALFAAVSGAYGANFDFHGAGHTGSPHPAGHPNVGSLPHGGTIHVQATVPNHNFKKGDKITAGEQAYFRGLLDSGYVTMDDVNKLQQGFNPIKHKSYEHLDTQWMQEHWGTLFTSGQVGWAEQAIFVTLEHKANFSTGEYVPIVRENGQWRPDETGKLVPGYEAGSTTPLAASTGESAVVHGQPRQFVPPQLITREAQLPKELPDAPPEAGALSAYVPAAVPIISETVPEIAPPRKQETLPAAITTRGIEEPTLQTQDIDINTLTGDALRHAVAVQLVKMEQEAIRFYPDKLTMDGWFDFLGTLSDDAEVRSTIELARVNIENRRRLITEAANLLFQIDLRTSAADQQQTFDQWFDYLGHLTDAQVQQQVEEAKRVDQRRTSREDEEQVQSGPYVSEDNMEEPQSLIQDLKNSLSEKIQSAIGVQPAAAPVKLTTEQKQKNLSALKIATGKKWDGDPQAAADALRQVPDGSDLPYVVTAAGYAADIMRQSSNGGPWDKPLTNLFNGSNGPNITDGLAPMASAMNLGIVQVFGKAIATIRSSKNIGDPTLRMEAAIFLMRVAPMLKRSGLWARVTQSGDYESLLRDDPDNTVMAARMLALAAFVEGGEASKVFLNAKTIAGWEKIEERSKSPNWLIRFSVLVFLDSFSPHDTDTVFKGVIAGFLQRRIDQTTDIVMMEMAAEMAVKYGIPALPSITERTGELFRAPPTGTVALRVWHGYMSELMLHAIKLAKSNGNFNSLITNLHDISGQFPNSNSTEDAFSRFFMGYLFRAVQSDDLDPDDFTKFLNEERSKNGVGEKPKDLTISIRNGKVADVWVSLGELRSGKKPDENARIVVEEGGPMFFKYLLEIFNTTTNVDVVKAILSQVRAMEYLNGMNFNDNQWTAAMEDKLKGPNQDIVQAIMDHQEKYGFGTGFVQALANPADRVRFRDAMTKLETGNHVITSEMLKAVIRFAFRENPNPINNANDKGLTPFYDVLASAARIASKSNFGDSIIKRMIDNNIISNDTDELTAELLRTGITAARAGKDVPSAIAEKAKDQSWQYAEKKLNEYGDNVSGAPTIRELIHELNVAYDYFKSASDVRSGYSIITNYITTHPTASYRTRLAVLFSEFNAYDKNGLGKFKFAFLAKLLHPDGTNPPPMQPDAKNPPPSFERSQDVDTTVLGLLEDANKDQIELAGPEIAGAGC